MYSLHKAVFCEIYKPSNIDLSVPISKTLKHTHIKSLTETTRTGKKIYFSPILQELLYKPRFIYIIKARFSYFSKLSIPTGNFNVLSIKASIKKSAITVNHSIADYFIKYNNCVIGFSFTSY